MSGPRLGRRAALGSLGLALGMIGSAGWATQPAPADPTAPDELTLLVAGPSRGKLADRAGALTPAISRAWPGGITLRQRAVGGADGVTAANEFEARISPDGGTALLLPAEAPLAWLAGDPRARFDAAHWVPVLTRAAPGVVCIRADAPAKLRLAAVSPAGTELPALLALDGMGRLGPPLFGIVDEAAANRAIAAGLVDAVLVRGADSPRRVAALCAAGWETLFALTEGGGDDAALSGVPTLGDAGRRYGMRLDAPLRSALAAASVASALDFALVLPHLTPAAMVAEWRQATAGALSAPELQAPASQAVWTMAGQDAARFVAALAVDPPTLLALRRWLVGRLGWQPV